MCAPSKTHPACVGDGVSRGAGHVRSLPTGATLARPHALSVRHPTLERWWCTGYSGSLALKRHSRNFVHGRRTTGTAPRSPPKAVRPIAARSKRPPTRRSYGEPSTVCWSSLFLSLKRLRSEAAICRRSLRSGPRGSKRAYWSIWRRN